MASRISLTPTLVRNFKGEVLRTGESTLLIARQIGRGACGAVYQARLESPSGIARQVAVKVMDSVPSDECDAVLERVRDAVRDAALFRHPNVIDTYDMGLLGRSQPYVMQELVLGTSLERVIESLARASTRMPLDFALLIGNAVADALAGVDLVHGSLTARQVILSPQGDVKVGDFGEWRMQHVSSMVRHARSLANRLTTQAPEVAHGHPPDARSDVFALGVLLHEMLVGPRFPEGACGDEIFWLLREGAVHRGVMDRVPPEELRDILDAALAVDPEERYASAIELASDLRRVTLSLGLSDPRAFVARALASLV